MTTKPFRWGLIGPGRIAHTFAKALNVVDTAALYAVSSRSQARADQFANLYDAPRSYAGVENLLADPQVDAVYIATPHRYHSEQARACLEAGKPVLCEKPLTVNAHQAQELVDLAQDRGVFLMEAYWTRFLPIYRVVDEWLRADEIGVVRLVTSTFGFQALRDPDGRLFTHELAGGALLDLGVYNVGVTQWVIKQKPEWICPHAFIGETRVDEQTAASIGYGDGVVSQFICSLRATTHNDMWIYGTRGWIRLHPNFWGGTRATLKTRQHELTVTEPWRENGFEYQIEAAIGSIQAGEIENPGMPHAATLENITILDQIRAQIGLKYDFE